MHIVPDGLQEENDDLREQLARAQWILKQLPVEVLVAFQKLWEATKGEVRDDRSD